jgi:hypothetical protein
LAELGRGGPRARRRRGHHDVILAILDAFFPFYEHHLRPLVVVRVGAGAGEGRAHTGPLAAGSCLRG